MKRIHLVLTGALLSLAVSASADIGGRLPPLYLAQHASLVVVGTASNGIQTTASDISFTIKVTRVVEGPASLVGASIPVGWALAAAAPRASTVGGTGLWFLQGSAGAWRLLPAMQGNVSFEDTFFVQPTDVSQGPYTYSEATPLTDAVAAELAVAIENAPPHSFRLDYLHRGGLEQLNSSVVALLYQRLVGSSAIDKNILGLAGQIRLGSANALAAAASAAPSFAGFALEQGVLLESVRYWFRAADPASVLLLGQTVDNTNVDLQFRRAAAFALAAIHTQSSLPYLVALMSDDDPELRAEFVRGLGSFANGFGIQARDAAPSLAYLQSPPSAPFRTNDTIANGQLNIQILEQNESRYLSFWQAWWQTNRAALGF